MLPVRAIILASRRTIHIKPTSKRCELVGPPDPVSHLRPVIYDELHVSIQPKQLPHPYSLSEFNSAESLSEDLELQYKLQRQQLDAFSHQFWLQVRSFRCPPNVSFLTTQRNRLIRGSKQQKQ